MQAKIYQPTKSAMQSGVGNLKKWILDYTPQKDSRFIDKMIGWTGSKDMNQEVRLSFNSKDEAINFANHHNIEYELIEPHVRKVVKKSYAENFK
jgi:DNA polymerase/3'-5' exonuclease PolX